MDKREHDKKIKLLICFVHVHIGGAMTSLVNFVNALDTDRYDVDLMFYQNDPNNRCGIKEEINILPQGMVHEKYSLGNILGKILSPSYVAAWLQYKYYRYLRHNKPRAVQIMSRQGCRYSRPLYKEYDAAVAYDTGWCMNYVMTRVKARKKLIWNHVEFEKMGLDYRVDKKCFDRSDAMVFVSEKVMADHLRKHPEHTGKCFFVPNLLTSSYVRRLGEEFEAEMPFEEGDGGLRLVTVARINFGHKGLDRAVTALVRLKDEGLTDRVRWLIIGGGRDMDKLKEMIADGGLENTVFPIGPRDNPMPYLKKCDAFFLPSRFEGKPMAVTEGYMMGLPPIVTEYASAKEQIRDGVDGLVFENSDEGLYLGLKKFLQAPDVLDKLKRNVQNTDYGNEREISAFDKMIDEIL